MFISRLPNDIDYRVIFSSFSQRHYIKRFSKDYKGKRWILTEDSIFQQLKRIGSLQYTQQVDELKKGTGCLLFKYDFAVAQTNISPKASGNRCVVFLDIERQLEVVMLVYAKTDLPKNVSETQFIFRTIKTEFNDYWLRLD